MRFVGRILLPQKPEGQFIELASVVGTIILKRIPAWLAMTKISDLLPRLGTLTPWSLSLCLTTLLFAFASLVSLFRAPKEGVRSGVRIYSAAITAALALAVLYLGYWGVIGLRTWV